MTSPGKPRYSRDPLIVTERILDAAQTVFMEDGFAGATTNRILALFGGSKATLFRHFPSKNDMLLGVVRRIGERLVAAVSWDAITEAEPRAWLVAFGRRGLATILRDDAIFVGRMVVAQGRNFPMLSETFTAVAVQPMLDVLVGRFRAWTAGGLIRCDDPEADALLFFDLLMAGWIARAQYGLTVEVTETFLAREPQRAADLFLDGRRPRG